jgi:hypothetical protein
MTIHSPKGSIKHHNVRGIVFNKHVSIGTCFGILLDFSCHAKRKFRHLGEKAMWTELSSHTEYVSHLPSWVSLQMPTEVAEIA